MAENEKLRVLKTPIDEIKEDAVNILREAINEDFETVLIMGIKDGKVYFRSSRSLDGYKKPGMIEAAKMEWFNSWA